MKKRKVLHYPAPPAKGGGVCRFMLSNLKHIDKSKFHFDFLKLGNSPLELPRELERYGCKVHYTSCLPNEDEARFIKEFNAVLDEGYDALHLHTSYWKGHLMEEIAVQRNISVIVVHAHNTMIDIADDEVRKKAHETHERLKSSFTADLATHFCACSNQAAKWLFGKHIPQDRIRVLNNAIDTDEFSYKPRIRDKYRNALGVEGSFVIGFVGRLCYQKNPVMLIDILSAVCKRAPEAKLLLIGTGELEKDLKDKVDSYGLFENVLFLGYRTDVPELLQTMDLFVLPSRFEGFGLSLAEAQCAGLKCLASEFVPFDARLTENVEFLPYDMDVWVRRIIEIADNPYFRRDMSEEIAKSGFSIKEQIEVLEEIYLGNT